MTLRGWPALVMLTFAACSEGKGDEPEGTETDAGTETDTPAGCAVTPPAAWSAPAWDTDAAEALALRAQLDALASTTMRSAEQGTVVVDELSDLTALYTAGSPSVADIATAAWDGVTASAFAEFLQITSAGAQDLVGEDGRWAPGPQGGIFEADFRGINEGGIEVRQLVDKGLFGGGGLYSWALEQTAGELDEAAIVAIAAAWGGNSALDPAGEKTDSANYTFGMGLHATMVEHLIAAKAYAADDACGAERDAAVVEVMRLWERAMFARFLHYAHSASALLAAPGSDGDVADALHELSEGLGLGLGFYGVSDPAAGPLAGAGRLITDAQLETVSAALRVRLDDLGASTTGGFVSDPAAFADVVEELEAVGATVYGFSASELASFHEPVGG
jgi:hypothetical protein